MTHTPEPLAHPLLLVYTGDGKGKTTAAVGQAVRALGNGFAVSFGQFMKRDGQAGEQRMLAKLLGDGFLACGKGFFRNPSQRPAHRAKAEELLRWAETRLASMPSPGLLVLDETLYALDAGLLEREEVEHLADSANKAGCHLLLTGRNVPAWLEQRADLISEVSVRKHPYEEGVPAQPGIEH